jgi:hypothetical protein
MPSEFRMFLASFATMDGAHVRTLERALAVVQTKGTLGDSPSSAYSRIGVVLGRAKTAA